MTDQTGDNAGAANRGLFELTQWSRVVRAEHSVSALNSLCKTYRPPLLAWLRCRGQKAEDAEDLVQGFFAHLLKQDFLAGVSPEKGRFRTFLLTSLQNYWMTELEKAQAQKRGSGQVAYSLDEEDEDGNRLLEPAAASPAPDLVYDQAWARELLTNALRQLEKESSRTGHEGLCRALEPVLFNDPTAPAYAEIAQQCGISEGAVKQAAYRLRQRLKALIREEVLQTVASEQDLETELSHLRGLFGAVQSAP